MLKKSEWVQNLISDILNKVSFTYKSREREQLQRVAQEHYGAFVPEWSCFLAPSRTRDGVWALYQSLACTMVGGQHPSRLPHVQALWDQEGQGETRRNGSPQSITVIRLRDLHKAK